MPDRSELQAFIDHARERGMDHGTIRALLLSAGWKEKEIVEAQARSTLDLPIPAPPDTGGAREAFLHLVAFAALYTSVIGLILLLFRYIERWFPDPAVGETRGAWEAWEMSRIRWSLALVLVAFPVFVFLTRFLLREMREHPGREWSGVRRWLTYLTLFVAAVALGGDVIAVVYRLLEGELTVRFIAKVLAVLVVAGLVFTYFTLSMRMPVQRPDTRRMHRGFAGASGALVLLVIVWGFVVAGSPGTERLRKLDERRLEDLQGIANEIAQTSLVNRHEPAEERRLVRPLPASLEEVARRATGMRPDIRDPQTGEPYVYEPHGEGRFRLCATFDLPRDEERQPRWNHPAGPHCFELDLLEAVEPTAPL